MCKTTKRLLCLLFTCLFVFLISISVAADAWIPPDNDCNYNLIASCGSKDECRAVNVFVSNYVEANVAVFGYNSDTSAAIKGTLKHFELNPGVYPDEVSSFRENGKTYMKLTSDVFERRVKKLFGRTVSAKDCPGYQPDGDIIVSADNYDATITVFGSVAWIEYYGNHEYYAWFDVFRSPSGVAGKYNIPNYDLPNGLDAIGSGYAYFYYYGDLDKTSFSSTDFELNEIHVNLSEAVPYANANEPYVPATTAPATEPAPTQAPATQATEAPTEAPAPTQAVGGGSHPVSSPAPTDSPEKPDVIDPLPAPGDYRNNTGILILFAVILVLSAVIVFLIIYFTTRSKRKREAEDAAFNQTEVPYQQPYYQQYPPEQYPQQQIPPEQQYPPQYPQQ